MVTRDTRLQAEDIANVSSALDVEDGLQDTMQHPDKAHANSAPQNKKFFEAASSNSLYLSESTSSELDDLGLPLSLWQRILLGYWPHQPPTQNAMLKDSDMISGFSGTSGHDFKHDVILRVEFISDKEYRVGTCIGDACFFVAMVALIAIFTLKMSNPRGSWISTGKQLETTNLVLGSICEAGLLFTIGQFVQRIYRSKKAGRVWSRRRWRVSMLYFFILINQAINVAFWIVPNAAIVSGQCKYQLQLMDYSGFIRWTCWNTLYLLLLIHGHNTNVVSVGGKAMLMLDAPLAYHLRAHWPKLVLWTVMEVDLAFMALVQSTHSPPVPEFFLSCRTWLPDIADCHATAALVWSKVLIGEVSAYFAWYLLYIYRGYYHLHRAPYSTFRMGHLMLRLQLRHTAVAFTGLTLTTVLLWFVRLGSCASFVVSWPGFAPAQIIAAALAEGGAWLYMPKDPGDEDLILQVWLQDFAWTEREKPAKLAERNGRLAEGSSQRKELERQPMFCVETALKLMYWAGMVYEYRDAADGDGVKQSEVEVPFVRYDFQEGLRLFKLEALELFHERSLDTKALMAYNQDTIVLSFRGTASLTNVMSNIKLWMSIHPPKRGSPHRRPKVHRGFLTTWLANNFNVRIQERISELIKAGAIARSGVRLLVTGHSLGGALAMLAAHELQLAFGFETPQCYTFGAPRPGNSSFAADLDAVVPDHWSIINDKDPIPHTAKLGMYSRPGQRVWIMPSGDIVVRPSLLENKLARALSLGDRVSRHYLESYRNTMIKICNAQAGRKGLPGGQAGVQAFEDEELINRLLRLPQPPARTRARRSMLSSMSR